MIPLLNQSIVGEQWVQNHSFFCLRNDSWQLQGMDTGYNDHDLLKVVDDTTSLRDDEAAWHEAQVAGSGGRKIILFSHHQLFSAFATIGPSPPKTFINPSLLANLTDWQAKGQIVAWLWGHEHLLEVYAARRLDGSGIARSSAGASATAPSRSSTTRAPTRRNRAAPRSRPPPTSPTATSRRATTASSTTTATP